MGFTEVIEETTPAQYRQYYLQYRHLKGMMMNLLPEQLRSPRSRQLGSADWMDVGEKPVGRFQEVLQAELQKVNQFACVKHEAIFLGLRRTCDDCKSLGRSLRSAGRSPETSAELKNMSSTIEAWGEEITHLDTYVRLNYQGFQRITRKFDAGFGVSGSVLFVSGLHTEPFCNVRFDDILILLGLAWAYWRAADSEEQSADANSTWKPPESFVRNTSKYWVRPDKVVLLKTRIVRQLPYLLFGASQVEQEKLLEPFALLDLDYEGFDVQSASAAYSGTMEESQLLSSVYFDSPDAVSYQERIHREEGARLVRFRWYGENNGEEEKEVYVERKIHREGWGGAQSAKERCILPQKDIFSFMKGKFNVENCFANLAAEGQYSDKARKAMKSIANEVNSMISDKRLQPIIRTSYYRCAFQLATSNDVRISLDTQMSLLDEYVEDGHPCEPWCHVGSDLLSPDQVYRFPFAILEIKLQNVSEAPLWLRETLADIDAIQVHKFSKFQHAMAFLHPERVPLLPHWHADFEEWHQRSAAEASGKAAPRSWTSLSWLQSSTGEDGAIPLVRSILAPHGEGHRLKDMQNLDPKGVFANERTLLHYTEKGLYVGALAVVLLHRESPAGLAIGGSLAVCTGLFYVWCLVEYYSRLGRIVGRQKVGKNTLLRLDAVHGPLVVASLILMVLAANLVEELAGSGSTAA